MFVVFVAGHQVDQRVALLLDDVVVAFGIVVDLAVERALPVHAAAHCHLVQHPRQTVGGKHPRDVFRLGGFQRVAIHTFAIIGTGSGIGVAGHQVPVRHQLTGQLKLDTVGGCSVKRLIDTQIGVGVGADLNGYIFLFSTEHRGAGIQAAIEVLGLYTEFVAVALGGCQSGARTALLGKRFVDRGVAAIDRVGVVDVIYNPGVGRYLAVLFGCGFVVLETTGLLVVLVGAVVLEVTQAAAEDDRPVICRLEACSNIGTVLVLVGFILAVLGEVRLRVFAVPVKNAAGYQAKLGAIKGCARLPGGLGGRAHHQLMLAAKQGKRAGGIDIEGVLYAMAFPLAPVEEHAITSDRVRHATTGGTQLSVMVVGLLGQAAFDFPVIGKTVFQGGEGRLDLNVTPAPVGGRVERAAEIGLGVVGEVVRVAGPRRAARLDVLVVHAEGKQGVRRQVGLDDAVEHVILS